MCIRSPGSVMEWIHGYTVDVCPWLSCHPMTIPWLLENTVYEYRLEKEVDNCPLGQTWMCAQVPSYVSPGNGTKKQAHNGSCSRQFDLQSSNIIDDLPGLTLGWLDLVLVVLNSLFCIHKSPAPSGSAKCQIVLSAWVANAVADSQTLLLLFFFFLFYLIASLHHLTFLRSSSCLSLLLYFILTNGFHSLGRYPVSQMSDGLYHIALLSPVN